MKLIDMTVTDFASEVDSNSPAPGGGSVSALASDRCRTCENDGSFKFWKEKI